MLQRNANNANFRSFEKLDCGPCEATGHGRTKKKIRLSQRIQCRCWRTESHQKAIFCINLDVIIPDDRNKLCISVHTIINFNTFMKIVQCMTEYVYK